MTTQDTTTPAATVPEEDPWDQIRGAYGATWLAEQLPGILASDGFMQRFIAIFQDVADSIRWRADHIEHYVDPTVAPIELLHWLGAWLDVEVEASWDEGRQREFVREIGPLFRRKGTRSALLEFVTAVTGGPVSVLDTGRIRTRSEPLAPGATPASTASGPVIVTVKGTGGHAHATLESMIRLRVPADTRIRLKVDPHLDDHGKEPR